MADVRQVKAHIRSAYERREAGVYAKSLQYAGYAINYFRSQQKNGAYWTNRTGTARDVMFSKAFIEGNIVGWFLSHDVEYGPYLEEANDGIHQAIRPIIQRYAGRFIRDCQELFHD
jgi:hypothetical protein